MVGSGGFEETRRGREAKDSVVWGSACSTLEGDIELRGCSYGT